MNDFKICQLNKCVYDIGFIHDLIINIKRVAYLIT